MTRVLTWVAKVADCLSLTSLALWARRKQLLRLIRRPPC